MALEWLASFHAAWWEEEPPEGEFDRGLAGFDRI